GARKTLRSRGALDLRTVISLRKIGFRRVTCVRLPRHPALTGSLPVARLSGMAHASSEEQASRTADLHPRQGPFGAPHGFLLPVIEGEDPSVVHRIIRPETVLGRGEDCHFAISDEQVSKVHCRIRVEGSVCTIVDPRSRT